jgi:hypothetical protein
MISRSNLDAMGDALNAAQTLADQAATHLEKARALVWCPSVTHPTQTRVVMCQLGPHDSGVRHWAYEPGIGELSWSDHVGRHLPEVVSGECDPDDEHDRAKESRESEPWGFE